MAKKSRPPQRGPMRAGPMAGRASAIQPLLDQAGQMLASGQGARAITLLVQATAAARTNPQAAHMLGVAYLQAGRIAEGIEALKKAIMLAPRAAAVLNHLGVALCQAGRAGEGIPYLQKALSLDGGMHDARNNLAHALSELGQFAEAIDHYRTLVAANPAMQPAWQGLASALHKSGDIDAAVDVAAAAVERFPSSGRFHASLGRLLIDARRPREAEVSFRKALALDANNGDAANNLGTLLQDRDSHAEALAMFETATRVQPALADGWFNLGNAQERNGNLAAAYTALKRAAALRPDNPKPLSALISVRRKLCDWDGLDGEVVRLKQLIMDPAFDTTAENAPPPFAALSLMLDPATQRRFAEAHSTVIQRRSTPWSTEAGAFRPRGTGPTGSRLRIGYLSPDFREHPIAQLMAGVIEAHDRQIFEISAWSIGPVDASPYRKRIVAGAGRFEDLHGRSVLEATALMRDADLDIVVDLAGYTAHARPELLALRVAPVQVNYLGFPGTMGAPFMDYILVDPIIAAEGDDAHYSERLVRLPGCYQANDNRAPIDPEPVTREQFGLPQDAFVFCCFSMNYKIDPIVMDVWAAILSRLPSAVLWLYRTDAAAADNIRRQAIRRGIEPSRLFFADRLPKAKHLARHRLADLFLDTFAYGAHTTASDALWAGLPVLTLKGDSFARRVGASIVTAAGLPDLVTHTGHDYVEKAVALASADGAIVELKARLAANLPTCPLFSTDSIARNLEAAYLGMISGKHDGPSNR